MLNYIISRILQLIPILMILSLLIFAIIELPPGDYLTMYIIQMEASGTELSEGEIKNLKEIYHLDKNFIHLSLGNDEQLVTI